ncbi:MAG: hypothetical protein DRJ52_03345 [Thermoprotei archaeon]|nr:MAG: hypothetical protein DRJ52_03345 [Thermoprotei archaeon]RLE98321.1 MAG: hypothetical protein DRJ63_07900 [Thermoprotei archaeon]HDI74585.1 hypothetical protein [Thermoprotei archaeon]
MKTSLKVSLTAIFAAMYYIMTYIPGIPVIGLAQAKIKIVAALSPFYGVILGPFNGLIAVAMGQLLTYVFKGFKFMSIVFSPPSMLSAFTAGLLVHPTSAKKKSLLLGLYGSLFALWIAYTSLSFVGLIALPHLIIFMASVAMSDKISKWIRLLKGKRYLASVIIVSSAALLVDHLTGFNIYIWVFRPPVSALERAALMAYVMYIERALFIAISTILISLTLPALKKMRISLLD